MKGLVLAKGKRNISYMIGAEEEKMDRDTENVENTRVEEEHIKLATDLLPFINIEY